MLKNSTKSENINLAEATFVQIKDKTFPILKDFLLVLSFAILTGIFSKIKIEIGLIPITMQTLVVLLSGALLGRKKGAASQISYLLLGLIGIPWFSRGGGMSYLLSPTFGYVIGFVLSAFTAGALIEKGWGKNIGLIVLAMLISNALIYVPGLLWLARFIGLSKILQTGLFPFVLGDLLKILLASLILSFRSKTGEKQLLKT